MKSNFSKNLFLFLLASFLSQGVTLAAEKVITAELASAPNVPAPLNRKFPARVKVNLEAKEYIGKLADGVQYKFWSFNGTVPGPMVRVLEGDTIEINLHNHDGNHFSHSIDIHAVNGPDGGGMASLAGPGEKKGFVFKALAPGLYIYHCASPVPNIPAHIANGMYGLLLVEPVEGLPKADKEFYVMKSEFFEQESDEKGVFELSMEKGLANSVDHAVFNGSVGSLTGSNSLSAKTGDNIRIFFGNIGPNSISSFHVIGEIFDKVYVEGSIGGLVNKNVQTTLVPSAGATIVEFKADVPSMLLLVDHSIFKVAKGAVGIIDVTGDENPNIFKAHE